jgi:hypothetical protein
MRNVKSLTGGKSVPANSMIGEEDLRILRKMAKKRGGFPFFYNDSKEKKDEERAKKGKDPEYFKENYENAKMILSTLKIRWEKGLSLCIMVTKEMQAGKTSDLKCFIETCIPPEIPVDERVFTTGDPDLALREQTQNDLEGLMVVEGLKKILNQEEESYDLSKVKVLIVDEDHFGQGEDSLVHQLYQKTNSPDRITIRVTATPSGMSMFDFEILRLKKGKGYYGIIQFLANDQIIDLNTMLAEGSRGQRNPNPYFFDDLDTEGDVVERQRIKPTFAGMLDKLAAQEDGGIGLMTTRDPLGSKKRIQNYYNKKGLEIDQILIAHTNESKKDNTRSIASIILRAQNLVMEGRKVLLIVQEALKAGYNLDNVCRSTDRERGDTVKNKVVFGVEIREPNANSHLQGILGRLCGYHNNTEAIIAANIGLCRQYRNFCEGSIDLKRYDREVSELERSNGRPMNPATHVATVFKKTSARTSSIPIVLGWGDYKNDLRNAKYAISKAEFEVESLGNLLEKCMISNKEKFGKSEPGKMVSVGARDSVTDSRGKLYYPNCKALSNNIKDPESFMKTVKDAEEGKVTMESFSKRSKGNRNSDSVNVGIFFVDSGTDKKIVLCLKGEFIEEEKNFSVKDTTMYTKVDNLF